MVGVLAVFGVLVWAWGLSARRKNLRKDPGILPVIERWTGHR
jgi:type IV secretory pathway TrbD component